jgi:sugar O-acyltransferase (sialic acid O-acetyltransferase NeuD family)
MYIYGAGGHGKVVAEAARRGRAYEPRAFLDDERLRWGQRWDGLPILGGRAALNGLEDDAVVALGVGSNNLRASVAEAVLLAGRRLATVVHPAAVVAAGASLGEGTYVAPLAVLHSDAWTGRGCIVNTAAVVDHDCRLGDWVHVSPHATLGGGVQVGEGAHVGLGAVLIPGLSLGAWATLGAGAVMVASLPGAVTAIGVPARIREATSP